MWEELVARLTGRRKEQALPEPDEKLALAALLVRVAKSDSFYHVSEIIEIDHILEESFDLNAVEAAKLRALAEKLENAAPETDTFASVIRDTVDYAHRQAVTAKIWQVILADGKTRAEEHTALHDIESHLGISAQDRPSA